jgi:Clp amino terminal domain, pathogenicity island component
MFSLEKAIADWRQQMVAAGLQKGGALDELESHLREDIEQQIQAGLTTQEAFESAVGRIGGAEALKAEFAKVSRRTGFLGMLKGFLLVMLLLCSLGSIGVGFYFRQHYFITLLPVLALLSGVAVSRAIRLGNRRAELPPSSAFTPDAQQSLQLARAEAPRLNHDFIGTEHVLLGLLNSEPGIVSNVMRRLGVECAAVRTEIEKVIGPGLPAKRIAAEIPYTPRATRALALAVKEAEMLQQRQVNSEHIFLGLIKENEGVAGMVLRNLGVDINRARDEIVKEMNLRKSAG